MPRPPVRLALLLGGAALVASCSGPPAAAANPLVTQGVLAAAGPAVTYDPSAAPDGARLVLEVTPHRGATTATLRVEGMVPDRGYAVHAHVRPCGPTGADAGPHYQDRIDPAATPQTPSSDPAYANPRDEVWLDLRTDATGAGSATTTVPFAFTDRAPESVVVHEKETTATAHGQAGTAGGRLACLTSVWR
ncbi:Cu-Zn family superoxide dismutase [Actinomycetospora succinea]|uniref:Cu-Zn family superoxide dismutase n=1 Tax=Actinomycetospora succinea TaxID=663603 RepID=A0A4R6UUP2_9PSEU|nr:superoxide dismutase family protein [Actinomycetospora succinea]TDQ51030.1 Cu-Zn family superoxide dismutase [Actinomycetospora succinea]